MRKIGIIVCFFLSVRAFALFPDPVKEFHYEEMKAMQGKLAQQYAMHKELDSLFELPTLIALRYYPELKKVPIRFRQKNIKTTMQSLPRLDFIFRKKEKWVFHIHMDKKVKNGKGLLLKEIPFNAQVGVIGHELSHIIDYRSKTRVGVILMGIGYLFPKKRRQIENRVDEITIAHGLGNQLKEFSGFVLNNTTVNEQYLKYKRKYYYTPAQLMKLMLKYPVY